MSRVIAVIYIILAIAFAQDSDAECRPVYNVKVVDAQDLVKEDADFKFGWITKTNNNDPYVDIYGYVSQDGTIGDDYVRVSTSTIDGAVTPVWEEDFLFAEGDLLNEAEFVAFKFMLYDDDSFFGIGGSDYLGETDYFYTKDIDDCNAVYSERMDVTRGGTLFVEISLDTCCEQPKSDNNDGSATDNGKDKGVKPKL